MGYRFEFEIFFPPFSKFLFLLLLLFFFPLFLELFKTDGNGDDGGISEIFNTFWTLLLVLVERIESRDPAVDNLDLLF